MAKCLLCTEDRGVQGCHIMGSKNDTLFRNMNNHGFSQYKAPLIDLCPNHHWYFDHNKLNKEEKEALSPIIDRYVQESMLVLSDFYKTMVEDIRYNTNKLVQNTAYMTSRMIMGIIDYILKNRGYLIYNSTIEVLNGLKEAIKAKSNAEEGINLYKGRKAL